MARIDDAKTMAKKQLKHWLRDEVQSLDKDELLLIALDLPSIPAGRKTSQKAAADALISAFLTDRAAIDGATNMDELKTAWSGIITTRGKDEYKATLGDGYQIT